MKRKPLIWDFIPTSPLVRVIGSSRTPPNENLVFYLSNDVWQTGLTVRVTTPVNMLFRWTAAFYSVAMTTLPEWAHWTILMWWLPIVMSQMLAVSRDVVDLGLIMLVRGDTEVIWGHRWRALGSAYTCGVKGLMIYLLTGWPGLHTLPLTGAVLLKGCVRCTLI